MTTQSEFHEVVKQLQTRTGDPNAWMTGLSPADIHTALLYSIGTDQTRLQPIVAKIRANHPTIFDPGAGAPTRPPSPPPAESASVPQTGAAATAIKKAESDLAQQNSSTATLDLLVISAILNAHATSNEGVQTLRALQREIDEAVRTRTDLDTPAGARDFQRFLVGKLRHIGAVVQEANLDDRSKAALATAWTALYESTKQVNGAPSAESAAGEAAPTPSRPPAAATSSAAEPPAAPDLPPYGFGLPPDPLADPFAGLLPPAPPASNPAGAGAAPWPSVPLSAPALPGMTPAAGGGFAGGPPAGLMLPRTDEVAAPTRPSGLEGISLEELLAAEDAALAAEPVPEPEPDGEAETEREPGDADVEKEPAADGKPESTVVELPGGEQVDAPTPALAKVLRAALAGTGIGEAFHQEGITIPPPGTPVPHPVDPARIGTGDVAMFTDRQALAIDADRALLDGQLRPVGAVSGPSFLGWLHPPEDGGAAPSATTPNNVTLPAPTRPAAAGTPAR